MVYATSEIRTVLCDIRVDHEEAQQIMKSVVHTINLKKLCHTNVSNLSIEHWISAIVETFRCVIFPSVIASAFGFYIKIYHQNIKLVLFPLEAH